MHALPYIDPSCIHLPHADVDAPYLAHAPCCTCSEIAATEVAIAFGHTRGCASGTPRPPSSVVGPLRVIVWSPPTTQQPRVRVKQKSSPPKVQDHLYDSDLRFGLRKEIRSQRFTVGIAASLNPFSFNLLVRGPCAAAAD